MTLKPSDPVPSRPEPAVGQVWRSQIGQEFWIVEEHRGEFRFIDVRGEISSLITQRYVVDESDTYVGQFAGFKVQEEGGK